MDEPVAMVDEAASGDPVYYYLHDRNYSVVGLVDSSGGVVESYEYSEFGLTTVYGPETVGPETVSDTVLTGRSKRCRIPFSWYDGRGMIASCRRARREKSLTGLFFSGFNPIIGCESGTYSLGVETVSDTVFSVFSRQGSSRRELRASA